MMAEIEQHKYQVRFDWATRGAQAIGADADVIIWVDVVNRAPIDLDALPSQAAVIESDLQSANAAANWVAHLQQQLGRRITIAVIAAGARRADGSDRFATEDQLAAGSFIDELAVLGLDATSPEAATAQAAFAGLKRAVAHLVSASVSATLTGDSTAQVKIDRSLRPSDTIVRRAHPELDSGHRIEQ